MLDLACLSPLAKYRGDRNINLIPALTFPPGLTFVFLKHHDKLNINIAYSPDIISHNELHLIEQKLTEILLADY